METVDLRFACFHQDLPLLFILLQACESLQENVYFSKLESTIAEAFCELLQK